MQHGKAKSRLVMDHGSEDHDEELWLVSYADMVTLLFGFFVILFSFSTLDDKKFEQMSEKMSEAFKSNDKKNESESNKGVTGEERQLRAMQMLISMLNLGENLDDAVAKIEKTFAEAQQDSGVKKVLMEKVAIEHREIVQATKENSALHSIELVLPDTSLFPVGSYKLNPEAAAKIQALAVDLQGISELMQIEVSGHTDSRPPQGNSLIQNNFTLSALRAGSVAQVLLRAGVEPKKISVRGMGSLSPVLPERDRDGQVLLANMAKNRRVTIMLKLRNSHDPVSH